MATIIELSETPPTEAGPHAVKLTMHKKPYVTWLRMAKNEVLWSGIYSGLMDGMTPLTSDVYKGALWSVLLEFRMANEEDF